VGPLARADIALLRAARTRGDEFRRYSYADVVEDPRFMLRELAALLGRRPG